MKVIDTCGKTVGLIIICFFGYSKKYGVLRKQGQTTNPTKNENIGWVWFAFFIELIFSGKGGKSETCFSLIIPSDRSYNLCFVRTLGITGTSVLATR